MAKLPPYLVCSLQSISNQQNWEREIKERKNKMEEQEHEMDICEHAEAQGDGKATKSTNEEDVLKT
jgi:hypothetical protein